MSALQRLALNRALADSDAAQEAVDRLAGLVARAKRTEALTLRQCSLQFSDRARFVRDDLRTAVPVVTTDAPGLPDVIGFTELSTSELAGLVEDRCDRAGYSFTRHGTVALAVHPRHRLVESGGVDVIDGYRSPTGHGSHQARGIVEVTFRTPARNLVTVHEAHWVTGYRLGPGGDPARERRHRQQTDAMIERVQLHGRGRRLSFWMGDTNVDERRDRGADRHAMHAAFTRGHLVSVYDELGTYPDTHGRATLDLVGSYDPDRRAVAVDVLAHPAGHSDHRMVDATYQVRGGGRRG